MRPLGLMRLPEAEMAGCGCCRDPLRLADRDGHQGPVHCLTCGVAPPSRNHKSARTRSGNGSSWPEGERENGGKRIGCAIRCHCPAIRAACTERYTECGVDV